MKKSLLGGIIALIAGLSSGVFAASSTTTTSTPSSTISITITSCTAYNTERANKTIATSIKNVKNISSKLALAKKYTVVMKVWGSRCMNVVDTAGIQNETGYFIYTNPQMLKSYTVEQQKLIAIRLKIYQDVFFKSINNLIAKKLLTTEDKTLMKGKVSLQYVANCNEFDGKISIKQWFNGNKVRVRNELIGFNINVNICFEPWFNNDIESNISQIMTHELGHFFYYFHDTANSKKFEAICWVEGSDKPLCGEKSFVSEYAMTEAEEDYAETFAFWALKKLYPGNDPQLIDKKKYFDGVQASMLK